MVNYGGAYSNFAIAEKSGSFLDKKKRYVFVFKINNSRKDFTDIPYRQALQTCFIDRLYRQASQFTYRPNSFIANIDSKGIVMSDNIVVSTNISVA